MSLFDLFPTSLETSNEFHLDPLLDLHSLRSQEPLLKKQEGISGFLLECSL